jgi:hypothetical protein
MNTSPDVNEGFAEFGRQIAKSVSGWEAAIEPIAKRMAAFQKDWAAIKPIAVPVIDIQNAFKISFAPLGSQVAALQKSAKVFLDSLSRSFEQLPPKNKEALTVLAKNGWYLDVNLSLPTLYRLAAEFTSGDIDEANNALCEYFESRVDDIESSLISQLPERSRLFYSAFNAHRREEFALSIPVFLSQADGICQKLTGKQIYGRNGRGIPKIAAKLLAADLSPFVVSMLTPIIEPFPIGASPEERAEMGYILNRHTVLHGESTDYDTRLNGCRAISFLVYVSWILQSKEVANMLSQDVGGT